MKKASIVSIGNELLSGLTVDTNASYLGSTLLSIGIPVASSYTVADEIDSIVRVLDLAQADADVIVATGGLGPTDDDLTRQAVAQKLGVDLRLEPELLERLEKFFAKRSLRVSNKCKIQAYLPAGSEAIANKLGTAPGIMAEAGGKLFFALPGVPAEMKKMFEDSVLPKLQGSGDEQAVVVRKLRCFGAGESQIAQLVGSVMGRGRDPLVNCTARNGVVTLHIVATARDKAKAEQLAQKDDNMLRDKLAGLVFGTAEQSLAEVVGDKLAEQNKTLAIAESCTGGNLARLVTDIPGASDYLTCGWVTYSNEAKVRELGVSADLLENHGAVSEQVASAMAEGAREKAGTDIAIGITGIAGPAGGSDQKPVGLVYISLAWAQAGKTERFVLGGNREMIRQRAARIALNMLRLHLEVD
jgi:nicotinamide-nucleotide amidase